MFWYSEAIQCLLQQISLLLCLIINYITTSHNLRVYLIYGMEYGLEWNGGMERRY